MREMDFALPESRIRTHYRAPKKHNTPDNRRGAAYAARGCIIDSFPMIDRETVEHAVSHRAGFESRAWPFADKTRAVADLCEALTSKRSVALLSYISEDIFGRVMNQLREATPLEESLEQHRSGKVVSLSETNGAGNAAPQLAASLLENGTDNVWELSGTGWRNESARARCATDK